MTTLILITPYVAFFLGAAMTRCALHLHSQSGPQPPRPEVRHQGAAGIPPVFRRTMRNSGFR